jgi:small acid-soluble spore protein F (minor alpha/beta-type SASP)
MMARRGRGIMSDQLKFELAKELGVYDTVMTEGWGGVTSRDCGNLVAKAIEKAEQAMANNVEK